RELLILSASEASSRRTQRVDPAAKPSMPSFVRETPAPHAVIEVVAADGARLRVRRHGNPRGPRLMLSHGNGFAIDGSFSFWSRFLGSFDVVVFDMRSHGQNPRANTTNHEYARSVPDLDGIRRDLGEE